MAKRKKNQQYNTENTSVTELVIPTNNSNLFIKNMNSLKKFSEQIPKEVDLPTVSTTGGLFGWFDHKVTGDELNELTENIQDRMIDQNKTIVKIVKEISTIYDTFSALDKVYVQEILIVLNAAIRANEKANANIEMISEQQKEINGAQQDIKQLINQQQQIIQVLKNFKEKLENMKHLNDIDKIYNSSLNIQTKIETLDKTTAKQKINIEKVFDEQTKFAESLVNLNNANDELNNNFNEAVCTLNELSTKLEKAAAQSTKNNLSTTRKIEEIKKAQTDFEKSVDTRQSELNSLFTAKYASFEEALANCEQTVQELRLKNAAEIEQASDEIINKYETVQKELTELRNGNAKLSKSLIIAKGISAASWLFAIVILILLLTGVLR